MCSGALFQSSSDGALLAEIGHRQLTLLPSKMLMYAGRKALVVAVEMVNYYAILKKELNRTGTENLGAAFTNIVQARKDPAPSWCQPEAARKSIPGTDRPQPKTLNPSFCRAIGLLTRKTVLCPP